MRGTRYAELGYKYDGKGIWRIYDTDTDSAVGPTYRTQVELLADLDRYAQVFGCEPERRPLVDPTGQNRTGAARWHAEKHAKQTDLLRLLDRVTATLDPENPITDYQARTEAFLLLSPRSEG
jgi:hypothetical protein